ncbi:MAG: HAMP domain-containing histidine kinase [Bacilli bacterium]|nr:HAMP domain-containing histidine kinase [Bacilli bacterium]
MCIWFYLFLLVFIFSLMLLLKISVMKKAIKQITKDFNFIIKSDTNSLITISTNDRDIKKLSKNINDNLKILRKLEIEYRQGSQDIKNSMTNISHDLRTPLTAIRGYLDLMGMKNISPKQKEYLKYIDEKTSDLINLTEQLFTFSKGIETYNELNKKELIINHTLEDVICSYYDLFKEKKIEPIINITNKKIVRSLDEDMLKRILENVIFNAIKYSENMVMITLNDVGIIEISNKTKKFDSVSAKKIFDRYYTIENAKKSNGIGLSIVKQLVELNGGKVMSKYRSGILTIIISFS